MDASAAVSGPVRAVASAAATAAAFERLFAREYARVAGIAYRVLGDKPEAEDVAQEVFVSFYRRHRPDASYAAAWLYTAATHTALNVVRARTRRLRRDDAAARELDRIADPEGEAIAREEQAQVRAALARLPDRTATLLVLRHSGLTYGEIAATLNVALDQVGTRLRRAQDALRKEVLRGAATGS